MRFFLEKEPSEQEFSNIDMIPPARPSCRLEEGLHFYIDAPARNRSLGVERDRRPRNRCREASFLHYLPAMVPRSDQRTLGSIRESVLHESPDRQHRVQYTTNNFRPPLRYMRGLSRGSGRALRVLPILNKYNIKVKVILRSRRFKMVASSPSCALRP
jgi:hypothetical protein